MNNFPLRPDLPPMPASVAKLPVAENGYAVPYFVPWVDGKPEFRAGDRTKLLVAVRERRCWVCGDPLADVGGVVAFVIGPMCSVNRVSAEPPCHPDCAEFSARACPFLSKPHMRRRDGDLTPEQLAANAAAIPGVMIRRNPGCCAVWATRYYQAFRQPSPDGTVGILFNILDRPEAVTWWAEGRPATRAEVEASIDTGLPQLRALCDGRAGELAHLAELLEAARIHLPA